MRYSPIVQTLLTAEALERFPKEKYLAVNLVYEKGFCKLSIGTLEHESRDIKEGDEVRHYTPQSAPRIRPCDPAITLDDICKEEYCALGKVAEAIFKNPEISPSSFFFIANGRLYRNVDKPVMF